VKFPNIKISGLGYFLFYLVIVIFLLIGSLSEEKSEVKVGSVLPAVKVYKVEPVFSGEKEPPVFTAQSVYALDIVSQKVLYDKNSSLPVLPASTTKIITALVALDYYPLDYELTVGKLNIDGQKMGLKEEEVITVDSLLKGLLIFSANDAAYVLADSYPGGYDLFISKMNMKAGELGLKDSYFLNPAGLDGVGQFTTAKDLAVLGTVSMENDYIAKTVSLEKLDVYSTDGKIVHKLKNINELIGKVDGVLGIKTGWTENAHENLVTYINRDGKEIVIALLGSEDRFGETENLINWIFDNYLWEAVETVENR